MFIIVAGCSQGSPCWDAPLQRPEAEQPQTPAQRSTHSHGVPTPLLAIRHCGEIPLFSQLRKHEGIAAVEELTDRQSRLCRFLGYPVAFAVVADHR